MRPISYPEPSPAKLCRSTVFIPYAYPPLYQLRQLLWALQALTTPFQIGDNRSLPEISQFRQYVNLYLREKGIPSRSIYVYKEALQ